jgi:hypothetical protein
MFSALLVFGRRLKGMVQLQPEQVRTCNVTPHHHPHFFRLFTFMILLAPVTNWDPHGVMHEGYCYAMRHRMKVNLVSPFRVIHLQRYSVTERGNINKSVPTLKVDSFQTQTFN